MTISSHALPINAIIRRALLLPTILLAVQAVALCFLNVIVIPQTLTVLESMRVKPPFPLAHIYSLEIAAAGTIGFIALLLAARRRRRRALREER